MTAGGFGPAFDFDPGALCLEFAYSGGENEFAIVERPLEAADLARWFQVSSLGLGQVTVDADELTVGRTLRQAIWTSANRIALGSSPASRDIEIINAAAAESALAPQLASPGTARRWASPASAAAGLSTIARDAVELFSGPYSDRIRICESSDCYLVFVDTSRPGTRRWCSMGRCGNRAKLRAMRARRATTP